MSSQATVRGLVICNRQIYSDEPWAIHAAGCKDVARTEIPGNRTGCHAALVTPFTGTVDAALASVLDEETVSLGYDQSHVMVYPCCYKAVR